MIPVRPSLYDTIDALEEISATNEDEVLHDLIATAKYVSFDHQSVTDEYSAKFGWGFCETCGTQWPCSPWKTTEYAIVEWLIKSSNSVLARFQRW